MKTAAALTANPDPALQGATPRSLAAVLSDLIKARLTFLVLVTTLVGFYMGLGTHPVNYTLLAGCMIGTMLCAAGAAALNQLWERHSDALMKRTQTRPLPTGELQPWHAGLIGILLSLAGLVLLWQGVNQLSAWFALGTILSYVVIYTPLKKTTSLNTLAGAVPGALPPVIGYVAAANRVDSLAWVLFGILFFWQLPHFLAISWIYREDYRRGGFVMLSCKDQTGVELSWKAFFYTVALTGVCILPWTLGVNSSVYLVTALLLNAIFLWKSFAFCLKRDHLTARKLFFTSIIYLPVLLGIMVFTRR